MNLAAACFTFFSPGRRFARFPWRPAACLLAVAFSGCASPHPEARAKFQDAEINRQPANIILDTGAGITTFLDPGARKLGIQTVLKAPDVSVNGQVDGPVVLALSEPVDIRLGEHKFHGQVPILAFAWYMRWLIGDMGADALVGWPQVRDNVLFFNGTNHTVSAITVPSDLIGWVPLGMHPGDLLILETQMPEGKTGTILVDTGSPTGVALPPARWKEWRAAHPDAPSTTRYFAMPNSDRISSEEAWADSITLGNLTLTDVPVGQADRIEYGGSPGYAGTLGLYALSRMDLIVDAANHTAYARPTPPPGAPYPGLDRPGVPKFQRATDGPGENWTVADNVRLNADELLTGAARIKLEAGDLNGALADCEHALADNPRDAAAYIVRAQIREQQKNDSAAIADYTRALELDPGNTEALLGRGWLRHKAGDFQAALADDEEVLRLHPNNEHALYNRAMARRELGDYDGAIADLTHFIQLRPRNSWAVNDRGWTKLRKGDYAGAVHDFNLMLERDPKNSGFALNLGATKQDAGDFAGAVEAYDRAIKLNPADSIYARLYRQLLLLRLGRPPGNFARDVQGWPPGWSKTLGQFVAGRLGEGELFAAAAQGDEKTTRGQQCEANYFAGVLRLAHGDTAGAKELWTKALAGPDGFYEHQFAKADLAHLADAPAN